MGRLNTALTPTGVITRADTVTLAGFPNQGIVTRVARDGSWVDVAWLGADGSFGWTKRMRDLDELARYDGASGEFPIPPVGAGL